MRIAVTTFFQSQTNYGQLLQAFALQQVLMRMGHYPYIIRYGFHEQLQPILKFTFPTISFSKLLNKTRQGNVAEGSATDRHFDDFRRDHLNLSKNAYNHLEDLQLMPPIADCYLTGSDQVWAQLLSCEDNRTFFLDFGPDGVYRLAYAPSFSLNAYPEVLRERLSENLKRFNDISVREKTGVEICRNVGYDAQWVVDPTMLLEGDDYRLLGQESHTTQPTNYMFVYHVNVGKKDFTCWPAFRDYNQQKGLTCIAVHANGEHQPDVEFLKDAEYVYPTIQDWIRWIDGSQYVLTTSFHGMIFAILLHKPFFIILRPESQFAGNDRVTTILSELNLSQRIVTPDMDVQRLMDKPIDWETVDKKLQTLRKHSIAFLDKNLSKVQILADDQHTFFWIQSLTEKWISLKEALSQDNAALNHQIQTLQQNNLQLQEQCAIQQSQLSTLEEKAAALNRDKSYLTRKRKKYLTIVRWLSLVIALLIVSLVLSIFK